MKSRTAYLLAGLLAAPALVNGIELDVNSQDSIKSAAQSIASDLMNNYYLNASASSIPGLLGQPYYFWEAGTMWDALVHYWYLTGDGQYNDAVKEALLFQAGSNNDYMPTNQTKTEGNDDQATWALAAISAAERNFPSPDSGQPSWLDLAVNVFNEQAARWDDQSCGPGLRWQIYTFNNGYNYKNSASQAMFFLLAARLAQFTGNQTYADWATKAYERTASSRLITPEFKVLEGVDITTNCSINEVQWSMNMAAFMYGSAVMYNRTNNESWADRTKGFLNSSDTFFKNDVLYEVACETHSTCSVDQRAYKALTSRWMAGTRLYAPFTDDSITPLLQASASGAAKACTGGDNGTVCGFKWTTGKFDGSDGVGEEMAALDVIQANLDSPALFVQGNSTGPSPTSTSGSASSTSSGSSSTATSSSGAAASSMPPGSASMLSAAGRYLLSILAVTAALF